MNEREVKILRTLKVRYLLNEPSFNLKGTGSTDIEDRIGGIYRAFGDVIPSELYREHPIRRFNGRGRVLIDR